MSEKKKIKSEQQVGDVPMADTTNVVRENKVLEDNKRLSVKR